MALWRALTPLITSAAKGGSVAADIGCGVRPFDAVLQRRGYIPIGVDSGSDDADCLAAVPHLPFRDETFPLTLCINVLQYVTDPIEACIELYRVTRPAGTVLIVVPCHSTLTSIDKWRWTEYAARRMLSDSGFEITEVVPIMGTLSLQLHLLALGARKAVPILGQVIGPLFDLVAVACLRSQETSMTGGFAIGARRPIASGRR